MFDSRAQFREAGFDVIERQDKPGGHVTIMVGTHPSLPDKVFKRYPNTKDLDYQKSNYKKRVEGVERIGEFIEDRRLMRLLMPRKWMVRLPDEFGSRRRSGYIIVADKLDIVGNKDTCEQYRRIDNELLAQLCVLLWAFPNFDANPSNIPFTKDGRIAFVDTESWNRKRKKEEEPRHRYRYLLRYLKDHLSDNQYDRAKDMLKRFARYEG